MLAPSAYMSGLRRKLLGQVRKALVNDVSGNLLEDGDTVTAIKDLKVKGSSLMVKVGTRVKNIRLFGGDHDIDCQVNGIGAMKLRSQFGKKAPR